MDYYEIWFDLAPGAKDLELCDAIDGWLGYLRKQGLIEGYEVKRCKLGFRPSCLPEFNVTIRCEGMEQLDKAFLRAASRDEDAEPLHREVYARVANFQSALYRSFPDDVRQR